MFIVNDRLITQEAFSARVEQYSQLEPFLAVESARYAICASDAEMVIALVELIRARNDSVLLLYGDTPLESALERAAEAGCCWLFYGTVQDAYRVHIPEDTGDAPPSLYQFSSGTTGRPKLIGRSWIEVIEELNAYNQVLLARGLGEAEPVILTSITHSYGLITGVLSALQRGAVPLICQNTNPKYMLQRIMRSERPLVYAVPALLQTLLPWLQARNQKEKRLYAVISSGAPLSMNLCQMLREHTDCLIQQYGCTEAGCVSLAVGMVSFDDLGKPLSHIQVQAASYPTEMIFLTKHGKLIPSGDLGTEAPDGRLRFIGRLDDLINVSGLKVHPLEVEQMIARMEGIQEVVVYRGAHPVSGDTVHAMIVEAGSITREQVLAWCQKSLPAYKVPSEIEFVHEIPRLPSGKISRKLLIQGGTGC